MRKNNFLLSTLYFLLSTFLIGCTTIYNPATGKKEVLFIDTAQEVAIGKNVAREVAAQYKVLEDESVQRHLQQIGRKIALVSDRRDLEYSFTVLDSKELNAFALPGGGVYINKGLLDLLDEDEIAACLGHEVGHIAARHSVKRIQGQMGYQLLLTLAIYGAGEKNRQAANTVAKGANSIFQLVLLGYSRQDELLADKLAVKYTHQAGYNPRGMVTALKKLYEQNKNKGLWRGPAVLRSHPYLEDRIRVAEAEVAALPD
jgi:predicted Zn-dependent protease